MCGLILGTSAVVSAQQTAPSADAPQATESSQESLPNTPAPQPTFRARHLTFDDRLHIYAHSITSLETVGGPLLGAAVNQARNEPPEWGQGAQGFGTRFASGYGRALIGRTIRFGVAAVDHEDPRFYRSDETGFWRRAKSATVHVFVARTDRGTEMPAFSRFAAIYGAAFISNAWYPPSRADTQHALLRGTTAFAADLGWNVFKEFWPDIKGHLRKGSRDDR